MSIRFAYGIISLLLLMATRASCAPVDPATVSLRLAAIEAEFRAGKAGQAAVALGTLRTELASAEGTGGIDARFAVRETVLRLLADEAVPIPDRLQALHAAVSAKGGGALPFAERQADLKLALRAVQAFGGWRGNDETVMRPRQAAFLDSLILAVECQLTLPPDVRSADIALFTQHYLDFASTLMGTREFDRLIRLATLAREEARLWQHLPFAYLLYYNLNIRHYDAEKISSEAVRQWCRDLERLTRFVWDQTVEGRPNWWRWKPLMDVGLTYYRLGEEELAAPRVQEALDIIRSTPTPEGQMRFAFTDMLTLPYDRKAVCAVADEFEAMLLRSTWRGGPDELKRLHENRVRWKLDERVSSAASAPESISSIPNVVPPGALFEGRSLSDWSKAYWRWSKSFVPGSTPADDLDGVRCEEKQRGLIWFLTGSSKSVATVRQCRIPANRHIFFPVLASLAEVKDRNPTRCPASRPLLDRMTASATDLRVEVDGQPLADVALWRQSTDCFFLQTAQGERQGMSDGFWLMLRPLPPGEHVITFGGRFLTDGFSQDVRYRLLVE